MVDRKYEKFLRTLAILIPIIMIGLILLYARTKYDSFLVIFYVLAYIGGPIVTYFLMDCSGEEKKNQIVTTVFSLIFGIFLLPILAFTRHRADRLINTLRKIKDLESKMQNVEKNIQNLGKENESKTVGEFILKAEKLKRDRETYLFNYLKAKKSYQDEIKTMKNLRVVEDIIQFLKDEDYIIRAEVANALGEIKNPMAIEPLIQALKDENTEVRKSAAAALGKIGDKKAIEPLTAALKDNYESVRENAVSALAKIGAPAVEPAR
jgi:hypothetical protein